MKKLNWAITEKEKLLKQKEFLKHSGIKTSFKKYRHYNGKIYGFLYVSNEEYSKTKEILRTKQGTII